MEAKTTARRSVRFKIGRIWLKLTFKPEVKVEKAALDYLVQHLRAIYTEQRNLAYLQDTGFTAVPKNYKEHEWKKAVMFFVAHGLNFAKCVKVRFDEARLKGRAHFFVHPNSLANDKYLPLYREACSKIREEIDHQFRSQKENCFNYWMSTVAKYGLPSRKDECRFVLLDEHGVSLSPLFRYSVACAEKLHDVAEYYERLALAQYLMSPAEYQAVWGKHVPERLIRLEEKLTGGLLRGV